MIDPITSATAPAPLAARSTDPLSRPPGPPLAATSAATAAKSPPALPAQPEPLSLDVTRGVGGVFVYTLSDPATGTVVAVIPHEDVQPGRNLDQQV